MLRQNPLVMIGSAMAAFFVILALVAGLIVNPKAADQFNFSRSYLWNNPIINWGPLARTGGAPTQPLGTDGYGRDLLQMMILAIPLDLRTAFIIVAGAALFGIIVGAISSYAGGVIDEAVLRITDIFFAFPSLVLALVFAALFGRTIETLTIAVLLVWWPPYVRLIRGQILAEKEKTYVEALRALGAGRPTTLSAIETHTHTVLKRTVNVGRNNSVLVALHKVIDKILSGLIDEMATVEGNLRILFRHILPNSIYPLLVQITLDIGGVILTFSALMFLGFAPTPAIPELGNLAAEGITHVFDAPWLILFPGLTIVLISLAFNLVGDGLRDVLDPRLRR